MAGAARVVQLKHISLFCGLPVSGRKDQLIGRIERLLDSSGDSSASGLKSPPSPVVLSIDLGVKNLAFSHLTPAPHKPGTKRAKKGESVRQSSFLSSFGNSPPRIDLHAWERLSILPPTTSKTSKTAAGEDQESPFGPPALAKAANVFLQKMMQLDPLPTHVLIERQRWRSGSGPAVQEWTIRVNSLEAMIYSSLQTLRDIGVWKGEVTPIRPESVGPFFLDVVEEQNGIDGELGELVSLASAAKSRKEKSENKKKLKIGIMSKWLAEDDQVVRPTNDQVSELVNVYRSTSADARLKSRPSKTTPQQLANQVFLGGKMDDLTDSLMQGMAWLRWQENRDVIRRHGIDKVVTKLNPVRE